MVQLKGKAEDLLLNSLRGNKRDCTGVIRDSIGGTAKGEKNNIVFGQQCGVRCHDKSLLKGENYFGNNRMFLATCSAAGGLVLGREGGIRS